LKSQITVFGIRKTADNFLIAGFPSCLNLTMKTIWSFETSETAHPMTQHHIPEGLYLHWQCNWILS